MVGGGGAAGMSELDMDQIDASADQICRKCSGIGILNHMRIYSVHFIQIEKQERKFEL